VGDTQCERRGAPAAAATERSESKIKDAREDRRPLLLGTLSRCVCALSVPVQGGRKARLSARWGDLLFLFPFFDYYPRPRRKPFSTASGRGLGALPHFDPRRGLLPRKPRDVCLAAASHVLQAAKGFPRAACTIFHSIPFHSIPFFVT